MVKNAIIDDGFQAEFIINASLDGLLEMPSIDREEKIIIPDRLVPYSKINYCNDRNVFCSFYENDSNFSSVLRNPEDEECLAKFSRCSGIITPDCSLPINAPILVQVLNIYRNRALGAKFQSMGLYTIANIRWGDERTYTNKLFAEPPAFLGAPKHSIVAIGSYGACRDKEIRTHFKNGLAAMLDYLEPEVILVYGPMPHIIFGSVIDRSHFIQYNDWTTYRHKEKNNGNR